MKLMATDDWYGISDRYPPLRSNPALQKADTDVNTPCHAALPNGMSAENLAVKRMAPAASAINVKRTIRRDRCSASRSESAGEPSRIITASRRPGPDVPRRSTAKIKLAPTMNPNPPAWIKRRTTASPNVFQWSAVSSTAKVPAKADTAVKKASTSEVDTPGSSVQGSHRRIVPAINNIMTAMRNRFE